MERIKTLTNILPDYTKTGRLYTDLQKEIPVVDDDTIQTIKNTNGLIPWFSQSSYPVEDIPISPLVNKIRESIERQLQQPFNHVTSRYFISDNDFVRSHYDRTDHLVPDSSIVMVCAGGTRSIRLTPHKMFHLPHNTQELRINLVDNSAIVIDTYVNETYTHSIERVIQQFVAPSLILFFRNVNTFYEPGTIVSTRSTTNRNERRKHC
jgi:hypothetical protein